MYPKFDVSTAEFSACKRYRYHLYRRWGKADLCVTWLMLNPSTADEYVLDPTLKRCMGFTQAMGYEAMEVVNLFALRSTDPSVLLTHPDPVGPRNDVAILSGCSESFVICGWGALKKPWMVARAKRICSDLHAAGITLHIMRLTQKRHPQHPLYLPPELQPCEWTDWESMH
jgi:hypothetical protein